MCSCLHASPYLHQPDLAKNLHTSPVFGPSPLPPPPFGASRPRNVSMSAAFLPTYTSQTWQKNWQTCPVGGPPGPSPPPFPHPPHPPHPPGPPHPAGGGGRGGAPPFTKSGGATGTVRCRAIFSSIVWNWPKRHGLWKRSLTFLKPVWKCCIIHCHCVVLSTCPSSSQNLICKASQKYIAPFLQIPCGRHSRPQRATLLTSHTAEQ